MLDPDVTLALIAHIRAQCPDLVTVDEAPFAEPIDHFDAQTPAALVYLAEDAAAAEVDTVRPVQRIGMTYGVWLVCKREDFRAQRHALRAAVFGWVPSEAHEPFAYRGGTMNDIRGDLIWWREFWTVDTWLRG